MVMLTNALTGLKTLILITITILSVTSTPHIAAQRLL